MSSVTFHKYKYKYTSLLSLLLQSVDEFSPTEPASDLRNVPLEPLSNLAFLQLALAYSQWDEAHSP